MKLILIIYFIFAVAWMGCKEEKKDTTKPFTGKIGDSVYKNGWIDADSARRGFRFYVDTCSVNDSVVLRSDG